MIRKVYVKATVKIIIRMDEGVPVGEAIETVEATMDHPLADLESFELSNAEVTDSK